MVVGLKSTQIMHRTVRACNEGTDGDHSAKKLLKL